MRTADEDNPKGYYEDERVKDLHQDRTRPGCARPAARPSRSSRSCSKSLPADNNYKVLFMQRSLQEIVASQNKMLARRGEQKDLQDERAVELLASRTSATPASSCKPAAVRGAGARATTDALRRPRSWRSASRRSWAGRWTSTKMAAIVDVQLYRNRS